MLSLRLSDCADQMEKRNKGIELLIEQVEYLSVKSHYDRCYDRQIVTSLHVIAHIVRLESDSDLDYVIDSCQLKDWRTGESDICLIVLR